MARCEAFTWADVMRELVEGGRGLDGYLGEQGLPVGTQVTEDASTITEGSLFHNGSVGMVKTNCLWRVQRIYCLNLEAWPRSPFLVGCVRVFSMGNSR